MKPAVENQYIAKHRFCDVSARKMRPFAQHVRGKNVDEALEQLQFYPNRGARLIEKRMGDSM